MARTVTRAQLRTRARQLSNMENALDVWPDADVNERIDTHTTALWDLLVQAMPPNYYATSTTYSVTSGTITYALPSDFMGVDAVYVQQGSTDKLRKLPSMRPGTRGNYQAPQASSTVQLDYVPNFTSFAGDSSTLDGVNGWDELVAAYVARDLLVKQRESGEQMDQKIAELRARIERMKVRDRSGPRYIRDVYAEDNFAWIYGTSPAVWEIKGSNLCLYDGRIT
jgi:hypothetical protein